MLEKKLRFEALTIEQGLSQGMINCILQDRFGFMWFATKDGLNRYDGYHFKVYKHDPSNKQSIADNYIQWIFEDAKGRFWVGTAGNGVDLFDRSTETFQHFTHNPSNVKHSIKTNQIQRIGEDESGRIWVISVNNALAVLKTDFNQQTKQEVNYFETVDSFGSKQNWPHLRFTNLPDCRLNFAYTSGIKWVVKSYGLYQLANNSEIKILPENTTYEKSFNSINIVFVDANGILWVGTKGYGVYKYNPQSEKFHLTNTSSIYFISPLNDGNVLMNCGGIDNLQQFDVASSKYINWLAPLNQTQQKSISNQNGIVDCAVQDADGTLWLGKQNLIAFNNNTLNNYIIDSTLNFIFPIWANKNKELWFGSEQALCCFNTVTKKKRKYNYPSGVVNEPYKFIESIYQSYNGILWIGTTMGLYRFDPKTGNWKQYKNQPDDSASLSFDLVFTICADPIEPERYLWIGTNGGLNKFDIKTGRCKRLAEANGLANSVIYGILSDADANLWMSTNKGISRYNPRKNQFRNFEIRDGLQSNEFNRYAYCKTASGYLFFGGVNGFNYFKPEDLHDNSFQPKVQFTDFRLNNSPVSSFEDGTLKKPIFLCDEIVLDYKNNVITIDFASFDFASSQRNLFQYKLEGFNTKWVQSGTVNSATYTNLNPGTYIFKVKGSNSDGVWNDNITAIRLIILPPWYMTWWFRLGLVLLVGLIIYGLYWYRLNEALQLQNIRNRIAGDLHDEIGSTLSSVSLFSEVIKKKSKAKFPEALPMLNRITENIDDMMEAMNDIVWTINAKNDNFEHLLNRIRATAVEVFEAKGYELHLDFDEQLNTLSLGMQDRKNLYLIIKEAINNIAKYAEGKNVWMHLSVHKKQITFQIKDDGIGFDLNQIKTGNGMFTMKKRASELKGDLQIDAKPNAGTSIQLKFKIT